MIFKDEYVAPGEAAVQELVAGAEHCLLATVDAAGAPRHGVFNPVSVDGKFFLHLRRDDEQRLDMARTGLGSLVFTDYLATIPSYWVDAKYAGAATAYYKFVEMRCRVEVCTDPQAMRRTLEKMMARFQPEGCFAALDPEHKLYKGSFAEIAIVAMIPVSVRTKWKLGQNRSEHTRLKVAEELFLRGEGRDLAAAEAVLETVGAGPDPDPSSARPGALARRERYAIHMLSPARAAAQSKAMHALFSRSYWAVDRPWPTVERSVRQSLCYGLFDRDELVGVTRVITDRATFAYLCDVIVDERHRGKGLGSWLVATVLARPELAKVPRMLLATRDAHGLYEKFGFAGLPDPSRFMVMRREGARDFGAGASTSI